MRAAEFITELGKSIIGAGLQAQQAAGLARRQAASARIAQQAQAQAPVPTPAPTAPTASSRPAPRPATPVAAPAPAPAPPPANTQAQARLAALGQTPEQEPAPKAPGIMGAIGKGVKAGLGMNPDQGFMRGLAGKALNAMNMGATASAVTSTLGDTATFTPAQMTQLKVGDAVDHPDPSIGRTTIKAVTPHGVTFNTKNTKFGSDLTISPQQMQQARIGIFKP